MKKVFVLLFAVITFSLTSCRYSESDLTAAERRAYEEGYADAEYYLQPDIWEAEDIAADRGYEYGYEHGYDIGYEDGYYDCLEEHNLLPEQEETKGIARIEKDRD